MDSPVLEEGLGVNGDVEAFDDGAKQDRQAIRLEVEEGSVGVEEDGAESESRATRAPAFAGDSMG